MCRERFHRKHSRSPQYASGATSLQSHCEAMALNKSLGNPQLAAKKAVR